MCGSSKLLSLACTQFVSKSLLTLTEYLTNAWLLHSGCHLLGDTIESNIFPPRPPIPLYNTSSLRLFANMYLLLFSRQHVTFREPHEKLLGILRVSNPATRKTWLIGPGAVLVLIQNNAWFRANGTNQTKECYGVKSPSPRSFWCGVPPPREYAAFVLGTVPFHRGAQLV